MAGKPRAGTHGRTAACSSRAGRSRAVPASSRCGRTWAASAVRSAGASAGRMLRARIRTSRTRWTPDSPRTSNSMRGVVPASLTVTAALDDGRTIRLFSRRLTTGRSRGELDGVRAARSCRAAAAPRVVAGLARGMAAGDAAAHASRPSGRGDGRRCVDARSFVACGAGQFSCQQRAVRRCPRPPRLACRRSSSSGTAPT